MNNSELKRYLAGIRTGIFCDTATKKIFMSDFSVSISDFLKDHPNAAFPEVEAHFGTISEVTDGFMCNIDPSEAEKARREQGTGFVIILSLLITLVIFLGWSLVYIYKYIGQIGIM